MTAAAKKDDKADEKKAAKKDDKDEKAPASATANPDGPNPDAPKRDWQGEATAAHMALAKIRKLGTENSAVSAGEIVEAITEYGVNTEDFNKLAAGV